MAVLSCSDRDDGPLFEFAWDQTKCADPWGTGQNSSNAETEIALTNYLEQNAIEINDIEFTNDSELDTACESCGCGTGQRILVTVKEEFLSQIQALGFYLK